MSMKFKILKISSIDKQQWQESFVELLWEHTERFSILLGQDHFHDLSDS